MNDSKFIGYIDESFSKFLSCARALKVPEVNAFRLSFRSGGPPQDSKSMQEGMQQEWSRNQQRQFGGGVLQPL